MWALVLRNNKIKRIDRGAFRDLNLKWLWLNNNELEKVESGWFKGMNQAQHQVVLDLSNNKITEVEKDAFVELLPSAGKGMREQRKYAGLQAVILKGNPDIAFPAELLKKLEQDNSVRVILPQEARARSLGATKTPLSGRKNRLKQLKKSITPLNFQQPTEPLSE